MRKLTLLLLSCCAIVLPVLAQEKALQQKIDVFMQAHKSQVYDFDEQTDAPLDSLQQHPLVGAMGDFFVKQGDLYVKVRKARFAQYAAPPAALEAVKWHAGEDFGHSLDMLAIVFMRSFEPTMPAQFVFNMLLPTISATVAAPMEEVQGWYSDRVAFGYMLYTRALSDSTWQVWCADRNIAVTFVYNLRNGRLAKLKYTLPKDPAYAGIKWPKSMVKALDEPAALSAGVLQTMWDHQVPLATYVKQNEARMKQAREEQLKPDVRAFTPPGSGYKEVVNDKGLDQDSVSRTYMYPGNWDVAVQNIGVWGDVAAKMARRNEMNRLIGYTRYVKQVDGDKWEIWTVHDTDYVHYVWNTRTGEVEKPHFWVKE